MSLPLSEPQAERWLEFLLSRKGRDAPMFLRKWLREAARKVGLLCISCGWHVDVWRHVVSVSMPKEGGANPP